MVSSYAFGVNKLLSPIADKCIQCHSHTMNTVPPIELQRPLLHKNDRILVVAPCGPIPEEPFKAGCEILGDWGLELCFTDGLWSKDRYLAGSDSQRAGSLVAALSDQQAKLVWMARGGYGATRIHSELMSLFPADPIPLIGFSDGTAIHAIFQKFQKLSFHGPVITQLHRLDENSLQQCRQILFDDPAPCVFPKLTPLTDCVETEPSPIWGGNLALLTSMIGTPAHVTFKNKIIFLEDVGEPAYRVDRMLQQLINSGELNQAAGIVFGHFTGGSEQDRQWNEVLWREVASKIPCPLWKGLAVGHGEENWTVPLGGVAQIQDNTLRIKWSEKAVT